MCTIYIILTLAIIVAALLFTYTGKTEHFNESSGQLCLDCHGKNFNQCLQCFNCVYGIDRFNQGFCVPGDMHGPYNNEEFVRWYHRDPLSQMEYMNNNYKCSYGPPQANRIISI